AVDTAFTVRPKLLLAKAIPSLTVTVMVATPIWLLAGVMVTLRSTPLPLKTIFEFGTNPELEELPKSAKFPAGVSTSPIMKGRDKRAPWLMLWLEKLEMTGGS